MDNNYISVFQFLLADTQAAMLSVDGKHPAASAAVGKLSKLIAAHFSRRIYRGQIAGGHRVFVSRSIQSLLNQIIGSTAGI